MTTEQAEQILEDLQADFDRQSGQLSWDDVHQVVLARSLSAQTAAEVWQLAWNQFHPSAEEDRPKDPITDGSTTFLSSSEERILARRFAAARLAAEADKTNLLPEELKNVICRMGKNAFDRLLLSNTRLVGAEAIKFAERTTRLELDDLFQEGILGLMHAVEKFDPDKGFRFTTYATWWIRQYIQRAIESKGRVIRLPSGVERELRRLKKKRFQLRQTLGHMPKTDELAHELGIAEGEVNFLLQIERDAELLEDLPQDASTNSTEYGRTEVTDSDCPLEIEKRELSELIREQLNCLDPRSRFIILQRFELDGKSKYTLQRLGDELNITKERVRQIEAKGLARLSEGRWGKALTDYIDG